MAIGLRLVAYGLRLMAYGLWLLAATACGLQLEVGQINVVQRVVQHKFVVNGCAADSAEICVCVCELICI